MGGNSDKIMETLQDIHLELCEIRTSLTGGLDGKPGLIGRVTTVERDTLQLKSWKNKQSRFIAKLILTAIGSGGIFGFILKIIHWI